MDYITMIILIAGTFLIFVLARRNKINSPVEVKNQVEETGSIEEVNKNSVLENIAKLVGIERDEKVTELVAAFSDPLSFTKENPALFEDYFLSENDLNNKREIMLITLYQRCFEQKLMWAVDWSEFGENVLDIVNVLLETKGYDEVEVENVNEKETDALLIEIASLLRERQLVLCELGRGNDMYELFIVSAYNYYQLTNEGKKLELSINEIK